MWMSLAPDLDRLGQQRVDQLDHRGVLPLLAGDVLVVDLLHQLDVVLDALHDRGQRIGGGVELVDGLLDGHLAGDRRLHVQAGDELDVVDGEDVARVGHGHGQHAAARG